MRIFLPSTLSITPGLPRPTTTVGTRCFATICTSGHASSGVRASVVSLMTSGFLVWAMARTFSLLSVAKTDRAERATTSVQ